ncbi:MAG: hypothetical protein AUJ28_00655 [Parcubacteria group bacterium CG1_02_37_51]|uniref:Baseplate protein J-like domain-containing protein n=2 Tax=Candidatus Komeiliibacteriota TaxID=1817908 RepID=A0A2M8DQ51_9BACT|nr:MAG: hypothetical protein AUJ28_00655 [Parcubacteria group bacterium CG1_02_37_51]PIY95399.1 MAG: hypothetical protein COY67_00180 [Candidatus Komeilibacteria bacterium CG_4_10_14_0_8_um_filter_37_78]PJC01049.1 MAG: hypothetical protein CO073_04490 [Candidatus Komeilibacteria bacterium CG_4_9_14_0_8_um_filter_36_9]
MPIKKTTSEIEKSGSKKKATLSDKPKVKVTSLNYEKPEISKPNSFNRKQDYGDVTRSHKKFIWVFALIIIVLAVVITHFSFAKATIYIDPQYTEHDISFSAQIVDSDHPDINDQNDLLVGRKLSTVITKSETYQTTATTMQSSKAMGEVVLINNYTKDQPLIATTRLLTADNKLFRLVADTVVPAGGTVTALAQADEEGDEYLIGPSSFIIPGLWEGLRDKIYAESNTAMSYQVLNQHALTATNIETAYQALETLIIADAMAEFSQNKLANEFINPEAFIVEEIREVLSAELGDAVDNFEMELELGITTMTYDEQKLLSKIENDINVLSEQNQDLLKFSNKDISISIKEDTAEDNNIIGLVQGKYKIQIANPNIDLEQIKNKDKAAATEYLNNLSGVNNATIQLWPFWLKSIPSLDNHIEIKLQ